MEPYVFEDNAYVLLDGELDLFSRDAVAAALPPPEVLRCCVIDLTRARYVDSTVLGMLVNFRQRFVSAGGDPENLLLLIPEEGTVERTFEVTGLKRLFSIAYRKPQTRKNSSVSIHDCVAAPVS